jgi:hypothetical protein
MASDCGTVLATYGLTPTGLSSDAQVKCVDSKCNVETPSKACVLITDHGLPTCGISPGVVPGPVSGPAPAFALVSVTILPSDCYLQNEGDTMCTYRLGACQADSDCTSVITSYLAAFDATQDIPRNNTYGCVHNKCDLNFPSNSCWSSTSFLPFCSDVPDLAPVSAPRVSPALAPVSILPSDCYEDHAENVNGQACVYVLGMCQIDTDCTSVLTSYLSLFGFAISEIPHNATDGCVKNKCKLAIPTNSCLPGVQLPLCSALPAPSPLNVHLLVSPPALAAQSPIVSSAATPSAGLPRGLFFVSMLAMAAVLPDIRLQSNALGLTFSNNLNPMRRRHPQPIPGPLPCAKPAPAS